MSVSTPPATEKPQRRFCGVAPRAPQAVALPSGDPNRARANAIRDKLWAAGTVLKYYFCEDPKKDFHVTAAGSKVYWFLPDRDDRETEKQRVREAFAVWANTGMNLRFQEVKRREDSHLRIGFLYDDGSWSYVGRDNKLPAYKNERTMNIGWPIQGPNAGTALHEIGHAIGLDHEHQNPYCPLVMDEQACFAEFAKQVPPWSEADVHFQVLDKKPVARVSELELTPWDKDSIMIYDLDAKLIKSPPPFNQTGVHPPASLSVRDVKWARKAYPRTGASASSVTPGDQPPSASAPGGTGESVPTGKLELGVPLKLTLDEDGTHVGVYEFEVPYDGKFTVGTFGRSDSTLVLEEERPNRGFVYRGGDVDHGQDKNAAFSEFFYAETRYRINVRVIWAQSEVALLII